MDATSGHMTVDEHEIETPTGDQIAVWKMAGDGDVQSVPIVLVPGFGRRMRHVAVIARHMAANGFTVYRCDLPGHIGLSSGDITEFTMSRAFAGIHAVVEHVRQEEDVSPISVVAMSLSFRIAVRLAAVDPEIARVVGLVGVVNPRRTLSQVFDEDLFARKPSEWPDYAQFERYKIASVPFAPDFVENGWLEMDRCVEELAKVLCPVVNFCGRNDEWVQIDEVRTAFAYGGQRAVVEMPNVEHELSRNPVAVNALLRELTVRAGALDGEERTLASFATTIKDLSFDEMAAQVVFERRREREVQEKLTQYSQQLGDK